MMENNHWVEEILKDRNIALIGFADLSEIDAEIRYGFQYGISIAIALKVFPSTTSEPSKEYYDEYKAVSARLRDASNFLVEKIKENGFNAYSLANEKQNEAYRTQLPFKTLATRSGLGWIGKSAALITKKYGNAIRLNGVLTDMPLMVGTPVNESFCEKCEECVKHCPGHAIKGNTWSLHIDRDNLLDAIGCKKAVMERGKVFNVTDGTCGICISVCPWTKRYKEAGIMNYEKAHISDLDEIFSLFQLAILDMRQRGIDQWDEIYPSKEILKDDILYNEMLISRTNNEIVAVIVSNENQEKEYLDGLWNSHGPKTAVIHRLCVKPKLQGYGMATKLMTYVEGILKSNGYNDVRLDAFSNNPHAVKLYKKLGYKEVGETYFRKGKFLLFEKVL